MVPQLARRGCVTVWLIYVVRDFDTVAEYWARRAGRSH